jgi:hypothetical protein
MVIPPEGTSEVSWIAGQSKPEICNHHQNCRQGAFLIEF